MLPRAVAVWVGILVLASMNGAVRDLLLAPRLGDPLARAISTVVLCVLTGVVWLVLTLAFEFLAGHYLFHTPWATLLADYDLRRGRIWVLVLLATLLMPVWLARARGRFTRSGP